MNENEDHIIRESGEYVSAPISTVDFEKNDNVNILENDNDNSKHEKDNLNKKSDDIDIEKDANEPEEEIFGVVDPNAIISALPLVGRRGRNSKNALNGSDSDDAYAAEDDEVSGSDEEEFDSSDEYDDDDDKSSGDEYYDEESRGKNNNGYIYRPQLPPILAALTDNMVLQKNSNLTASNGLPGSVNSSPMSGNSNMTAAQFQEMARNAVSSLAVSTSTTNSQNKTLPILLPRTPQSTENIRENVS